MRVTLMTGGATTRIAEHDQRMRAVARLALKAMRLNEHDLVVAETGFAPADVALELGIPVTRLPPKELSTPSQEARRQLRFAEERAGRSRSCLLAFPGTPDAVLHWARSGQRLEVRHAEDMVLELVQGRLLGALKAEARPTLFELRRDLERNQVPRALFNDALQHLLEQGYVTPHGKKPEWLPLDSLGDTSAFAILSFPRDDERLEVVPGREETAEFLCDMWEPLPLAKTALVQAPPRFGMPKPSETALILRELLQAEKGVDLSQLESRMADEHLLRTESFRAAMQELRADGFVEFGPNVPDYHVEQQPPGTLISPSALREGELREARLASLPPGDPRREQYDYARSFPVETKVHIAPDMIEASQSVVDSRLVARLREAKSKSLELSETRGSSVAEVDPVLERQQPQPGSLSAAILSVLSEIPEGSYLDSRVVAKRSTERLGERVTGIRTRTELLQLQAEAIPMVESTKDNRASLYRLTEPQRRYQQRTKSESQKSGREEGRVMSHGY